MTPGEARTFILENKHSQFPIMPEMLNEAFRIYWRSRPSREDFELVMHRCPLSPTMLWDIVQLGCFAVAPEN